MTWTLLIPAPGPSRMGFGSLYDSEWQKGGDTPDEAARGLIPAEAIPMDRKRVRVIIGRGIQIFGVPLLRNHPTSVAIGLPWDMIMGRPPRSCVSVSGLMPRQW